jgi:hypothetical protein
MSAPVIDGIDTTGWSREWRNRLRRATPGLSVPANTPRGRSERRFLALLSGYPEGARFLDLCNQTKMPSAGWTVNSYVRNLLFDLRRVGSVSYNDHTRRWALTGRGALVADASAEWVVGPVDLVASGDQDQPGESTS